MRKLTSKDLHGSGTYGYYYRTSKLWGAKIGYCRSCADGSCAEDGLPPQCWDCRTGIRREAQLLSLAYKHRMRLGVGIPKPRGVVKVTVDGRRYLAVGMQHLVGEEPDASFLDRDEEGEADHWNEIDDAHSGNFIVERGTGRLYRIDLGLWRPSKAYRRAPRRGT